MFFLLTFLFPLKKVIVIANYRSANASDGKGKQFLLIYNVSSTLTKKIVWTPTISGGNITFVLIKKSSDLSLNSSKKAKTSKVFEKKVISVSVLRFVQPKSERHTTREKVVAGNVKHWCDENWITVVIVLSRGKLSKKWSFFSMKSGHVRKKKS